MKDLFDRIEVRAEVRSNRLFYGDNLTIMRNMPKACIDLIYLDPPFNSQRSYNLIYKQATGLPVPEQEEAFCDTWEMDAEKEEMVRQMPIVLKEHGTDESLIQFWTAWINALRNTQPRLLAYLVYMTFRLLEMRTLLKPTGSLYLHCDPTANHYIKVIMDGIFGHQNFRNEIIWQRTSAHSNAKRFGPNYDTILFYTRSDSYTWNNPKVPHKPEYVERFYRCKDEHGRFTLSDLTAAGVRYGTSGAPWRGINPTDIGRHWAVPKEALEAVAHNVDVASLSTQEKLDLLDKAGRIYWPSDGLVPRYKRYWNDVKEGQPIQAIWSDIPPIGAHAQERLGYPTQKPIKLLQRIIEASSRPGDVVFDPFCGCGTAIYAAHLLNRRWIGCDIAILSVQLVRDVLKKRYGLEEGRDYEVSGVPRSVEGARELFRHDPHQFQHWAVELAGGFCSNRRSGDKGIDGRIYFETSDGFKSMVISVKGGKLTPAHIRELAGTLNESQGAVLGGLICLNEPTKGMRELASQAGVWRYLGVDYPRLQVRTIEDLLNKKAFATPSRVQTLDWERQTRLPI